MENKTNINWFPGHMTRTKRQLEEAMKQTDVVIELRDARAPYSSANPLLEELMGNKARLIVLAKADLADDDITKMWIDHFESNDISAIYLNIITDNVRNLISLKIKSIMEPIHQRQIKRGIRPRASRALVVGIPNVGKSTLINRLANKKVATTANKPGLTRALKLIKINKELELVDSPGMLWPRFEDEIVGIHLGLIGSINEDILPYEKLVEVAYSRMPDLNEIFELKSNDYKEFIDAYGLKYNYLLNNHVDEKRSMLTFLRNLKNGEIKKLVGRNQMTSYERKYWDNNLYVAGIDEAGRGPMAGPLVVALVVLPLNYQNDNINDSKVLSDKKRRILFDEIINDALYIDVEVVNEKTIDDYNIYNATKLAMEELIMRSSADYYLVDAMKTNTNKDVLALIKGDLLSISIAAASIIAKVLRDDIMLNLHDAYPDYGFNKHKGYPTKLHKENLIKFGCLPFHRLSFKPVSDVLNNQA